MNLALSASQVPPVSPLLADYHARENIWDEMLAAGRTVRVAWQPLVRSLAEIDQDALARVYDAADKPPRKK